MNPNPKPCSEAIDKSSFEGYVASGNASSPYNKARESELRPTDEGDFFITTACTLISLDEICLTVKFLLNVNREASGIRRVSARRC